MDNLYHIFLIRLGDEYYAVIDEFMAAIHLRWPNALIQHEDFQSKYAVNLLKRYRLVEYILFVWF